MENINTGRNVAGNAKFELYCSRHALRPAQAVDELVSLALALPADILDYLREQAMASAA